MTAVSRCSAGAMSQSISAAVVSIGPHVGAETTGIAPVSPRICACSNQRMELEEKAVAPGRRWQPVPPRRG